jgi:hypothetical protein
MRLKEFFRRSKVAKALLFAAINLVKKILATSLIRDQKFINIIKTFDLLNNFVDTTLIMRSKVFKFIKLHLWLIYSPYY